MEKKLGYLLVVMLLLSGCATIGSIERNYALIDYSDGIDKEEAILIGKKDLISADPKTKLKYKYRITGPLTGYDEKAGVWTICFVPRYIVGNVDLSYRDTVYCLDVDRSSGEILASGEFPYSRYRTVK
ncbi:hypothetical protein ACFL5X_00540 [Candidatus Omnitrophota bacterium]